MSAGRGVFRRAGPPRQRGALGPGLRRDDDITGGDARVIRLRLASGARLHDGVSSHAMFTISCRSAAGRARDGAKRAWDRRKTGLADTLGTRMSMTSSRLAAQLASSGEHARSTMLAIGSASYLSPRPTLRVSSSHLAGTAGPKLELGVSGSAGRVPDTVWPISWSHRISAGWAVNPVQLRFPLGCVGG